MKTLLFRCVNASGFSLPALVALAGLTLAPASPARAAGMAMENSEDIAMTVGRSLVIDYAADIGRISTSNPDVVDAVAVSTREVLLHAKSQGMATIVIWSKAGRRTVYSIVVDQNLDPARKLLKESFPNLDIQLQGAKESISLNGTVPVKEVGDRAAALMAPFAKVVVNNLRVISAGPEKQIILRVKFAELNRNNVNSLGVNLISTGMGNTPGSISTGQFEPPKATELSGTIGAKATGTNSKFTISDALNVFAFRPDLNLAAFVKALASQGVLQILAEPNLMTTNGKEASFLVGGEFPVPIVQSGTSSGGITIMFKEFGIRLTFKPEVTDHGTIKMYVKPEVSTTDLANSVTLSGFLIPALATRRMETNIELGEGQSFVIAGLIDDHVTENMSRIPGLAHIPILGVLFKSRSENRTKTELLVMVTPEIATPMSVADLKPLPKLKESLPNFLFTPSGHDIAPPKADKADAPKKQGEKRKK